jgi:hypothetical protein
MVDSRGDMRGRHDREKERERGTGGYRGSRGALPAAQQQSLRDKRTRWFVALFDYDPQTMSPNPDACEEELPFQEGDSIKVKLLEVKLIFLPLSLNNTVQQRSWTLNKCLTESGTKVCCLSSRESSPLPIT